MLAEENYRPPCFFANSVVEVLVEAPTRVFSHLHVKALFDAHVYQAIQGHRTRQVCPICHRSVLTFLF